MIRSFLAFDVSNEIKENLSKLISRLKIELPDIKWVNSENLHGTIKFFGDIEESVIEKISEIILRKLSKQKPIFLEGVGLGVFPSINRDRVVWAGVGGEIEELKKIVSNIEIEFDKIGFPKEERAFSPHLTIGRIKKTLATVQKLEHILKENENKKFGETRVERLTLYRSVLTGESSIYKVLKEYSFAGDM